MIAKVYSAIPYGYEGKIITVEGDTSKNLPCFNIVGMATKTIFEARERVRAAITNSGFTFPAKRVTINLAPAELTKDGTHLDLPIALTILAISDQLPHTLLQDTVFIAELSLSGELQPVRGIINAIETAQKAGFKTAFIAQDNLQQAQLIPNITIITAKNLTEVYLKLLGQAPLQTIIKNAKNTEASQDISKAIRNVVKNTATDKKPSVVQNNYSDSTPIYLDQIRGQALAKRGLTIALAGRHNILFTGPPGTGKTLLARSAINLLPPPTPTEQIEITKIHSLASSKTSIISRRPFRSPHHTASASAILGGGNGTLPGEISLAHRGILFLDEMPEFPRNILESLRQPLEDRQITITRTNCRSTYPADFILIGTMNPCPCGHLGNPNHLCICTEAQIQRYQKRISGPILDRIDLIIPVQQLSSDELLSEPTITPQPFSINNIVKNNISLSLQRQLQRYKVEGKYNGTISSNDCKKLLTLSTPAKRLLKTAFESFHLSARSYHKIIKVARTIADLDDQAYIQPEHISEALNFRSNSPEH